MKKLFIHHPLFRLVSPLFSGTLIYLLILLINNTLEDAGSSFFTQELYICIGLSYVIQETARLIILLFDRLKRPKSFFLKSFIHLGITLLSTWVLVSMCMYVYFVKVLSYTPNFMELVIFNSIFSLVAIMYVLLYVANKFLYTVNTEKLKAEKLKRLRVEEDFLNFKQQINPQLLLESLETILVVMKKDPESAEGLTEDFASVYRYLLSAKNMEMINLKEELEVLKDFVGFLNRLPFCNIELSDPKVSNTLVVPGSLLYICETIVRSSIPSKSATTAVSVEETANNILIKFKNESRINKELNINNLSYVQNYYKLYSSVPLEMFRQENFNVIAVPKLQLK